MSEYRAFGTYRGNPQLLAVWPWQCGGSRICSVPCRRAGMESSIGSRALSHRCRFSAHACADCRGGTYARSWRWQAALRLAPRGFLVHRQFSILFSSAISAPAAAPSVIQRAVTVGYTLVHLGNASHPEPACSRRAAGGLHCRIEYDSVDQPCHDLLAAAG